MSRSLSLLAAFFSLVGCTVGAVLLLFLLAPLDILKDAHLLSAFTAEQSQALPLTFLKLHALGYTVRMLLFGSYNILIGYLIVRSIFLPRILGALLAISGVCYQIDNFAAFLSRESSRCSAPKRNWDSTPQALTLIELFGLEFSVCKLDSVGNDG